uniref:Delta-aminolevulinic acid dehydratase n=1 Tax=Candidatus Methanomethylicus mesodigestus TaxID=1867258 RepID=A0A7C3EWB2_9CREN
MDVRITSRLRKNGILRDLSCESDLNPNKFIMPVFVKEGGEVERSQWGGLEKVPLDDMVSYLDSLVDMGIRAFLLFGLPNSKDPYGSSAFSSEGVVQRATKATKEAFSQLAVLTDVCLCQYTDHGHCGILEGQSINRDKTLNALSKIAVSHAEAGADIVAPSAMSDGQVAFIRAALDASGFDSVAIMSYSAKYFSSLYAPFREVASSSPSFGDRSVYQMDIRNRKEAMFEALEDVREGADIIMVKPAITNLDIISDLRSRLLCPIAAYQVSGEYAMIKAYCERAGASEARVMLELLGSIRRAGADMIITYFAPQAIAYLREAQN